MIRSAALGYNRNLDTLSPKILVPAINSWRKFRRYLVCNRFDSYWRWYNGVAVASFFCEDRRLQCEADKDIHMECHKKALLSLQSVVYGLSPKVCPASPYRTPSLHRETCSPSIFSLHLENSINKVRSDRSPSTKDSYVKLARPFSHGWSTVFKVKTHQHCPFSSRTSSRLR